MNNSLPTSTRISIKPLVSCLIPPTIFLLPHSAASQLPPCCYLNPFQLLPEGHCTCFHCQKCSEMLSLSFSTQLATSYIQVFTHFTFSMKESLVILRKILQMHFYYCSLNHTLYFICLPCFVITLNSTKPGLFIYSFLYSQYL